MKNKAMQTALILLLAFLLLAVAAFVVSNNSLTNPTQPIPWQPAGLATETPALTPTDGWWNELPNPDPTRTPTPTPTPEGN